MATVTLSFAVPSPFPSRSRNRISGRRRRPATITAAVSDQAATSSSPSSSSPPTTQLPLRKIPGDYGLPFIGPIQDRLAFFYWQGRDEFFKSRMLRYGSTVFRTNMPPGPFIASDSRVIVLLDAASFPVLFDDSIVEKRDVFTGTFAPSVDLTGGFRVLSYLDPSESNHAPLRRLLFFLLTYRRHAIIPEFSRTFGALFDTLESEIAAKGKGNFDTANDQASFSFLGRSFFDRDPRDTKLGNSAPGLILKWVLFQIAPVSTVGLPAFIEDPLLHSFRLPPALVLGDYNRLVDYFRESAEPVLDEAERMGLPREEALHNILFTTCFNIYGGMKILFPALIKWIGRAGVSLHSQLAAEVRTAVREVGGGVITMGAVEAMPLIASAAYEALRIEPPVPLQYARAKRDMVVASHDAAFQVRAGEMLFGYQPFATRDPLVFDRAEEFVADRFVGPEGNQLLRYVLWSNRLQTESPTTENKQGAGAGAGKNFVVLLARLLLVELFLRYDSLEVEAGTSALGTSVNITSLKKATA